MRVRDTWTMLRNHTAISIDPLRRHDLPAALNIQKAAYPPFLVEDEGPFLSRITLANSYCFAARRGEELVGYLLAHGWKRQSPPAVGTTLTDDVPSEVLFIHDLAVSSSGRGLAVGQHLIERAFALAARDGLRCAELIAVEGAADYWRRLGFGEAAIPAELSKKVAAYGALARWMTRDITPGD